MKKVDADAEAMPINCAVFTPMMIKAARLAKKDEVWACQVEVDLTGSAKRARRVPAHPTIMPKTVKSVKKAPSRA